MTPSSAIPVVVAGATGRTGRVVARAIHEARDMTLVGAIGQKALGVPLGNLLGDVDVPLTVQQSIEDMPPARPVLVDFTEPDSAFERLLSAAERGWDLVVGTTGFTSRQQAQLTEVVREMGIGAALIANFSLGAWVMEKMAKEASRYFAHVEVVEAHSDSKKDRPSGTARRMSHMLSGWMDEPLDAIPVHSLRLPGMVAHQRVLWGGDGEVITIGHDVHDRTAYVAGVLATIRAVRVTRGRLLTDLGDILPIGPKD